MFRKLLLAITACWTLAACAASENAASADPPAGRDCFNAASVNGYSPLDANRVKLTVSPSRHYAVTTAQRINDARYSNAIAIRTRGSDWICTGNGLGVSLLVPGGIPETYIVTSIERLPEEPPAPQGS
jgi:hypothetical protein